MKRLGFYGFCVAVDGALALFAHSRLPERVPVHWGADGVPDGYGPRAMLTVGGFVLTTGIAALVAALQDRGAVPSREASNPAADAEEAEHGLDARRTVERTVTVLMVAMHAVILAAAGGALGDIRRGIALVLSAFALVAGNTMTRLRPNRYVGVRTRATLSSPYVWRRTHRLAGPALVIAGVVCAALAFVMPTTLGYGLAFGVFLAASLAPIPYAYWLAKTHRERE